jgi:hypothetical protein
VAPLFISQALSKQLKRNRIQRPLSSENHYAIRKKKGNQDKF